MASSTTSIRPTPAGSTGSGACTSGSTVLPGDATKTAPGCVTTTATRRRRNERHPPSDQKEKHHEDAIDRIAEGLGRCAPKTSRQGEGNDQSPRCAGRGAAAHAVACSRKGLRVRRSQGQSKPARYVRGPPPVDRLPRVLRARRARLAG